jgi:hypothetical protein
MNVETEHKWYCCSDRESKQVERFPLDYFLYKPLEKALACGYTGNRKAVTEVAFSYELEVTYHRFAVIASSNCLLKKACFSKKK